MDPSALQIYCGDAATEKTLPVRGVVWVLRWAAAVAMLTFAALVLTAFAFQVAAERALRQAAAAGLREAALPRATSESVESIVRRQLSSHRGLNHSARIQLDRSGVPVKGAIGPGGSEPLYLTLTIKAADRVPSWLSFLSGNTMVTVRSVRPL